MQLNYFLLFFLIIYILYILRKNFIKFYIIYHKIYSYKFYICYTIMLQHLHFNNFL